MASDHFLSQIKINFIPAGKTTRTEPKKRAIPIDRGFLVKEKGQKYREKTKYREKWEELAQHLTGLARELAPRILQEEIMVKHRMRKSH